MSTKARKEIVRFPRSDSARDRLREKLANQPEEVELPEPIDAFSFTIRVHAQPNPWVYTYQFRRYPARLYDVLVERYGQESVLMTGDGQVQVWRLTDGGQAGDNGTVASPAPSPKSELAEIRQGLASVTQAIERVRALVKPSE